LASVRPFTLGSKICEIRYAGVIAKRADRAVHVHGSDGSKTVTEDEPESGNLGIGNGEMLEWLKGLGSKPCKRRSILNQARLTPMTTIGRGENEN